MNHAMRQSSRRGRIVYIEIMMKSVVKPTVIGTRSGYVIRFTCPSCFKENSIVYNMPKAYYKESREGTCIQCRKHYTVLTPD
ncbi:MAG: hypothetical protein A4E39_00366 [Methanoregulaceae archaeon PtaB.Bin152]|nr:MAG: hypothetical protein A4E39_00366 [Methanoregulaceae archaeon PtaB.Bin152]